MATEAADKVIFDTDPDAVAVFVPGCASLVMSQVMVFPISLADSTYVLPVAPLILVPFAFHWYESVPVMPGTLVILGVIVRV